MRFVFDPFYEQANAHLHNTSNIHASLHLCSVIMHLPVCKQRDRLKSVKNLDKKAIGSGGSVPGCDLAGSCAGGPEAARATRAGGGEGFDQDEIGTQDRQEDELGDAVPGLDGVGRHRGA
jgi:hypothetical protein